jgi:hypothetical protein
MPVASVPRIHQPRPFGGSDLQMIRNGTKRKMWLLVDTMLKSPKRDWFAAVLIARVVNRAMMDGEPVYQRFKLMPTTFVKAKDADVIR